MSGIVRMNSSIQKLPWFACRRAWMTNGGIGHPDTTKNASSVSVLTQLFVGETDTEMLTWLTD